MLLDLHQICNKYSFKPKGVIHVGAHLAEEFPLYNSLGINNVIWIEGNEKIFNQINNNLKTIPGQIPLLAIVSDEDGKEFKFNISDNGKNDQFSTHASSILEPGKHLDHYPHVTFKETETVTSITLDTLLSDNSIDTSLYDFINLDIQGAELLALQGFKKGLPNINYVYLEVNEVEIYKGCPLIGDIDNFLKNLGFERTETHMTVQEWGDAFYIRKELIPQIQTNPYNSIFN